MGILADAGILQSLVYLSKMSDPSDLSDSSDLWAAPLVGARFLATWSRGVAPKTRGSAIVCYPTTPLGCRTGCLTPRLVRHPGGVENLSRLPLPRSSALRASTRGLKNDDPYGAPPLRDRQAEHQKRDQSMEKHGDRGYHFLAVKLKCVTPAESLLPYLWRNTNTDIRRV